MAISQVQVLAPSSGDAGTNGSGVPGQTLLHRQFDGLHTNGSMVRAAERRHCTRSRAARENAAP